MYITYNMGQYYKVIIDQLFHEKEDFMMRLFGVSGRTQEFIDHWENNTIIRYINTIYKIRVVSVDIALFFTLKFATKNIV